MRRWLTVPLVLAIVVATLGALSPTTAGARRAGPPAPPPSPGAPPVFEAVGRYETGLGEGSGEIVAYGDATMYVTNSAANRIDVVDVSDPSQPALLRTLDLSPWGVATTSVAVSDDFVAATAVPDPKTDPGKVVLFDHDGTVRHVVDVGALPDMLTFTPDGRRMVVANEGEPNDDYSVDPEGSVTVVDLRLLESRFAIIRHLAVRTASFWLYDLVGAPEGVRVFGPGATPSQDFEPEYISIDPDGRKAYVTLQENNALATINLAFPAIPRVEALGTKDHSLPGNGLDPSDRDGGPAIATWPVEGLYLPDAIASYEVGRRTYHVTANEGDAREYETFEEEARVKDLDLDPGAFPDAEALQEDDALGRLTVTTTQGDTDGDGDFDALYALGGRSFSIWDDRGNQVYDSGDDLEQRTSLAFPANFNATNDENDADSRSDNKGPEPEAVTTGEIGGRTYAFVGLERIGGVMVYDVTDPRSPAFVQYLSNRDFTGEDVGPDSGPEGLAFVPADESPDGVPLLLVSHEITGNVTVWRAGDSAGELSLLHNNDGESSLLPLGNEYAPRQFVDVGGIGAFAAVTDREIADARDAGRSVLNVYAGDAFLASATLQCSLLDPAAPVFDAVAQRQLPYDAHILGNHEFDYQPDFLERFIREFDDGGGLDQPFLSANLDFSGEPGFDDLVDADGLLGENTSEDGRVVARSAVITDETTGEIFGVVGATTPLLPTISSPLDVTVTPDLATTADTVQTEVDRLELFGVRRIVLVSHLQDVANDREILGLLSGVDVAVAGGGDELLANDPGELLPGEAAAIAGPYPLVVVDADGDDVPVVSTAGNYKYLGRLDITFDGAGEVVDAVGSPRRVVPVTATSQSLGITDAVTPDPELVTSVEQPVRECLTELDAIPVATVEPGVVLDVSRAGVRGGESNGGDIIADSWLYSYDVGAAASGLAPRSAANPVIGVQNGGGIRQNAGDALPNDPNGIISELDVINVLPFDNTMTVLVDLTPAELKAVFEHSGSALPGQSGGFLQVAGIEVTYDSTEPVGSRVVGLTLVGDPADPSDDVDLLAAQGAGAPLVDVVTNSFTAGGGDGFATFAGIPDDRRIPLRAPDGSQLSYAGAWRQLLIGLGTVGTEYAAPQGRITILP